MPARQEVLNVLLAQLLQERGLIAAPEQILRMPEGARQLPDVLVDFRGLRLAIEAETGMTRRNAAFQKAVSRVESGIAHIGVAVVYAPDIPRVAFDTMKALLEKSPLGYAVITESFVTGQQHFPFAAAEPYFNTGTVNDLCDAVRRSYEELARDETLDRAVEIIEAAVERFLVALQIQPATIERMAETLNIGDLTGEARHRMTDRQRRAVGRVGALILVNAMIFQEVLSQKDGRVRPLDDFRRHPNLPGSLHDHWKFILDEINYNPIFHIAHNLLLCFSADLALTRALEQLTETARTIVDWRAALRHDLAGRIYHRLLEEAKYLGAFYTAIPSATLLVKLALRREGSPGDWSDLSFVGEKRIADLACGTGTLLMAAADAIIDNYVRACAEKSEKPRLDKAQQAIVEKIIYGYDVMPSAVHLTASTLSLRVPETPVNVTHLYKVPLGGNERALGTLDLLQANSTPGMLFGQAERVLGRRRPEKHPTVSIPNLDLCVMNPPFTRSVGGNLLFGNLPERERQGMQGKLKNLVQNGKVPANITAGLGSVFAALGDRRVKNDGRLALVLPRALVSGVAWRQTRKMIEKAYYIEYIVVSHEPGHWNFSENTNLSEVLLVARRRNELTPKDGSRTTCVNLWRQPQNAIESLGVANLLIRGNAPKVESGQGTLELVLGERKIGEVMSLSASALRDPDWSLSCSFAQSELLRALYHLSRGRIYLPGKGMTCSVPLCALGMLGELGFDCRDMHDGFALSQGATPYPALWGHDTSSVVTMHQQANRWLQPLAHAKKGRPLRLASHLWSKAGRLLIPERLWLNTARLSAVRLDKNVLANVWWTFVPAPRTSAATLEKALTVWLNSTLGILLLLGRREETRGGWVKFKKPVLREMPVLDVKGIGATKRKWLAEVYEEVSRLEFAPLPRMASDKARATVDERIAGILGLADLSPLREALAKEPIVCLTLDRLMHE
jgi:hypothetical protein